MSDRERAFGWLDQIDSGARPDARRELEGLLFRLWEQNEHLGKQLADLRGRLDKAQAQQRRDAGQLRDLRTQLEGLEHRRSLHLTDSVKCFTGDELLKWGLPDVIWGRLAAKGAAGVTADLFPVVGGLLYKDKGSREDWALCHVKLPGSGQYHRVELAVQVYADLKAVRGKRAVEVLERAFADELS